MPSQLPERVGADVRRRLERAWMASVGFVTLAGIVLPGQAAASLVQDLVNYVLLIVGFILQWIIFFLGQLVILLVNVVIDVAQYNNFANAVPVTSGWPLVRDVVNMFFIVILLVTAFSTIIQWKKFDYRKVLPKLLLMAVMVNFSKTLIGILIDFSQILMLTFVNAFKAAAAGNFVSALKLNKIMQLKAVLPGEQEKVTGGVEAAPKDSVLLKLVLAELLGIFFLGTTLVMLLIMIVYLVARVVGLWIALIFSPGAFFATALAGTPLSSKISLLGDKYWARLGALLSGGPIMAFFLWLTLATVQQSGGISGFTQPQRAEGTTAVSYFSSAVGNMEDVATYFVAIIMLLMGIEAAVAIAGEVSATLGKASQSIRSTGMAATRFATYGAAAAGGLAAARGAKRVAGGAARAAERRLELRERLGGRLQQVGAATGIAGIAAAGAGMRRGRAAERAAAGKRMEEAAAGMAPEQRMQFLERAGRLGGDKGREAQVMLARQELAPEGARVMTGRIEAEGKAKGLTGADLAAYTQTQAAARQGGALGRLEQIATSRGDQDMLKYVREQKEKRPDLLQGEDFNGTMGRLMAMDSGELSRTVGAGAYQDTRVSDAVLQRMMKPDGTLDESSLDYRDLMKGGGMRANLLQQRLSELQASAQAGGQPLSASGVQAAMGAGAGAFMARVVEGGKTSFVTQTTEQMATARGAGGAAMPGEAAAAAPVRREAEIKAAKERLERMRAEGASGGAIEGVQGQMLLSGAKMTEAFQV
ncbi:MAG TPA: hypothetical protein VN397_03675, partial [Candidatus Methylomirabilis sp.]|nr:hypothetical protein [Candidatus Methylomirabilis sp.]